MDETRAKFEVRESHTTSPHHHNDWLTHPQADYCPPIDPALLYSILSDYDLSIESGKADAKTALDEIREFALLEEAAEFDPSGTALQGDHDGSEEEARTTSRLDGSATSSRETDMSSLSYDMSGMDVSDASTDGTHTPESDPVDLEAMDEDTKVDLLLEVFRNKTTAYNVRYTLRKCNGRWDAAMDELLNEVGISEFMQSEGGVKLSNKSIDAFAEENGFRRGRRSKGKKKSQRTSQHLRSSSNPGSPMDSPFPVENKWQTSSRDAELLASRTGLPLASVQSLHNSLGASLPKTIAAVLKARSQKISQEDREDPIMAANAYDLQQDFPSVEYEYIFALIHITHPSTASAHEVATELTARPRTPTGGVQIIPQYARPVLDDADSTWQKAQRKSHPATPSEHLEYDIPNVSGEISKWNAARAAAIQQAHAAYRKSKSNHLMGGAAAYYSQESRNYSALSSQLSAQAADQLAARQSTRGEVDLHGVDVLNAVRIAQERVGQWWSSLGENRVNGRVGAESRQAGYRIVVGLGTHSVGGKGKLGPAVTKALKGQGWKIENHGAVILVKGR